MSIYPLAGKSAPAGLLIDPAGLEREYYNCRPDVDDPDQLVSFGAGGYCGSPADGTFTETHVLAVTQAICDYRRIRGIDGPLMLGKDTRCLSGPIQRTTLEVLAANGVPTVIQRDDGATPTPVISWAILAHNRGGTDHLADGIVITPSHDPPGTGGLKYNLPTGGPADVEAGTWIEERANELLLRDNAGGSRMTFVEAVRATTTRQEDFVRPYVEDLRTVIDLDAIRGARLRLAVDPLGGAADPYWHAINKAYNLNIEVVSPAADPTCGFMPVDRDGQTWTDCSPPHAMAGLVGLRDRFPVAFGNNPDAAWPEIVTPAAGVMNPNYYLAVAVRYLLAHRPGWPATAAVAKTLASSGLIDRVVGRFGRVLCEVPSGFHWFTNGLFDGSYCFGGVRCGGASFLRHDGTVWTTDMDGIVLALLAAELTARTGRDPGEHAHELTAEFGTPYTARISVPSTAAQKMRLRNLTPAAVTASTLAGEPITALWTRAPGNGASIGGLKVVTASGWFVARPSATEEECKLDAESFRGPTHLDAIVAEGQRIVAAALIRQR